MTIRFVSVVGADTGLLDAALQHYRDLGVGSVHIARHVDSLGDPEFQRSCEVMTRHGLTFASVHQGPWDEDLNAYLIRAQMRRHPQDWWIVADLDEFHVYDRPLAEIIDVCEAGGYNYVRGAMLDRVAADGSLRALDPAASVWEQYPLAGLVTQCVLKAVTSKVTLARGDVHLHPGQHWALNGRDLPAAQSFAQVHHFKWTESVLPTLAHRVEAFSSGDWYASCRVVTEESLRMLKHLEANSGRIDVTSGEFMMRRSLGSYSDYDPWPDLTPILSLRDGLRPGSTGYEEIGVASPQTSTSSA